MRLNEISIVFVAIVRRFMLKYISQLTNNFGEKKVCVEENKVLLSTYFKNSCWSK